MKIGKIKTDFRLALVGLAIVVGLFYVGTPLMVWRSFDQQGNKFVFAQFKTTRDPLYTYLPRAREIYEGHFPASEIYGDEQKPSIRNPLPSVFLAGLIGLFGGNINTSYLAAQFIFSIVIFLLFYWLGTLFLKSRPWSLFLATAGTLTPLALILPFKFDGLTGFASVVIKNFIPLVQTQVDKLYLHDIDNPLLTYPVYLLAIGSLFLFWTNPKRLTAILAGAAAGLLAYTYFHYWAYWTIVVGTLFLYVLLFARQDKERLKNFFILMAVFLVITLPYLVTYAKFQKIPDIEDYVSRLGMAQGRAVGFNSGNLPSLLAYGLVGIAAYFLYKNHDRQKLIWILAVIGSMYLAWNVQLATGFVPLPHTWQKAFSPILFILLVLILRGLALKWGGQWPKIEKVFAVVLILLTVGAFLKKTVNIISLRHPQPFINQYYAFSNDIVNSWDWMNKNLTDEPKIVSPSTITSLYLVTYTSARPFLPIGFITLLPMEEIEDRYLAVHKLLGVPESFLRQRLEKKVPLDCNNYECFPDKGSSLNDSVWHIYGHYFLSRYGSFDNFAGTGGYNDLTERKMSEKFDELVKRYSELKVNWKNINAEYVYHGPLEKHISQTDLGRDPNLALVYRNPSVEIYKIKK